MSDTPARRLSRNQVVALRFAARRQLAHWSNKSGLSPHQHAQRTELRRAAHILQDDAFTHGCVLRVAGEEESVDG